MYGRRLGDHEDMGDIELSIRLARHRLAMGLSVEETVKALVERGVAEGPAFNATIAAKIMEAHSG
jgi:hypothetical protein